ncbi:MAG TPA: hypothetical protein VD967_00615 [Candidatus Paceibacterota bacterium]|nr:hypothetical protein [Candidatus Paceibacterota bacterium]
MRIGVLGCFYGCAEALPKVLAPWLSMKEKGKAGGHEFVIAVVHSQFKEYAEMGVPDTDEATLNVLNAYAATPESGLDFFHHSIVPLPEHEARTIPLKFLLSRDVDLVWLLDGDEFYTEQEIGRILDHVSFFGMFDYYRVFLKTYIFDGTVYMDGFAPPRIFSVKKHGGASEFYWDNNLRFRDGTDHSSASEHTIPKEVAFVRHLTWLHGGGERKVAYQKKRFGDCSFRFNKEKGELEFDPEYYAKYKEPFPQLFRD